jgi:SHS2 domain-containing protein
VRQVESQLIEVSAEDAESLLFEWLNNLIYLFDVEYFLCKRFEISEFTEYNLKATCWGEKYDPSRHQLKREVKSATYHMLKVDRQQKTVQVIFDV